METESIHTPQTYLLQEVEKNIKTLKIKVNSQKKNTKRIQFLSIGLGAAITLTLGLSFESIESQQQNIALLLSALLTAVNGWCAIFDYKKLWHRQKSTLLDLYQLKNEILFTMSLEQQHQGKWDDLFKRYQIIWEENGTEWRSIVRTIPTHTSSRVSPDPTQEN